MDWQFSTWKGFVPVLVVLSFAGLFTLYLNSKYSWQPFKAPRPQTKYLSSVKRILFFTPYFGMEDWGFGFGSEPFGRCPVKNCFVTNKGEPEDFDAVLFHARNFKEEVKIMKLYIFNFFSFCDCLFLSLKGSRPEKKTTRTGVIQKRDMLQNCIAFWTIVKPSTKFQICASHDIHILNDKVYHVKPFLSCMSLSARSLR